jgi:hypothetical protein
MTTTGYGNQVPSFIHGRFLAVIVMLFGSIFMAMPLAIIGNEYTNTSHEVNAEYNAKSRRRILKKRVRTLLAERKNVYFNSLSQSVVALQELVPKYLQENDTFSGINEDLEIVKLSPILYCFENVEKVVEYARFCVSRKNRLSAMAILSIIELQSAFGTLAFNIENCLDDFQKLNKNRMEAKGTTGYVSSSDISKLSIAALAKTRTQLDKLIKVSKLNVDRNSAFNEDTQSTIKNKKMLDTSFSKRYDEYSANSKSIRNRLWLVLELHHSSVTALFLHFFSITIIVFSVIMFFSQSSINFIDYGESSKYCEQVVEAYCSDKNDFNLDPGCFVQNNNGVTSSKLFFYCDTAECFGMNSNFGSTISNQTCSSDTVPFQTNDELI